MTLRIGVIGTGFARRVQLPALRLVEGVTVTAIASGKRVNAEAVAKEFAIPGVYDDGAQVAAAHDVDLVLISSTPATHARYTIAALEAGKHVVCEKPTALNASEAQAMRDAAARHPRQLAWLDHELRYEPNRVKVRDLIRAGAIGTVRHIELLVRPYLRGDGRPQALDAPWSWWYDAAQGGGILGAVGSHLIDQCRFWTGQEIVEVSGGTATFVPERLDGDGMPRRVTAEEYVSCMLRLAGGAVASMLLTTVAQHGTGHFAQITGSTGTLVLTRETQLEQGAAGEPLRDVSAKDDLWERTTPNNMWARSFVRLMRDAVRVIGGATPQGEPAGFGDGWRIQRVMDAIRAGGGRALD